MNASRRPAPLPLLACLLRTPRRLTSSRFSPSGKSLPSSPLVLTTSRRLAPLPLLLIALLALGVVLLWSTPAEGQTTSRILVSNVSQGNDDAAATSGNEHAQLFHTAPNTGTNTDGWVLTSLIVVSEDPEGDDFDVEICEVDSNELPASTCTALLPPGSFTAGNLEFSAGTGMLLSANTNYTAVFKQSGTGSVTLDSTTSGGQDSTGLSGWSIKDKFDFKSSGTWQQKDGGNEAIQITVNGFETVNHDATGRPIVLPSAEGAGILAADTSRIDDANGIPFTGSPDTFVDYVYTYRWIRVDGNTETDVGADSARYQPVEADVGKLIKVEVSFTDRHNYSESATSLPFGPVADPGPLRPPTTLVSNTGQTPASVASITQQYAMGFQLGDHGQGYEISSVSIDLTAAPSSLTVSLWTAGTPGSTAAGTHKAKLFEFQNPDSFTVGLNEFTAPPGAFAHAGLNYFVVLSGFGASLSINETTSDNEDAGGETGATLYNDAGGDSDVLRLAVKGSRRTSGILVSTYAQPSVGDQEIISLADEAGFGIHLGAADRYLIRGVSFAMDDTTSLGGPFTNPFYLRSGSLSGARQFDLANTRDVTGLPVWTAPRGASVVGSKTYVFDWDDFNVKKANNVERTGATLSRLFATNSPVTDAPSAPGVTISSAHYGDIAIPNPGNPLMAVFGEPLYAMVQNLGQADKTYYTVGGGSLVEVVSQGFTTGPNASGYRLQGIGVNIEGSGGNVPDGPTSVSVAVHADSNGKPGAKLFDLLSPTDYAAGHSFFEAPPGSTLDPDTSYVMVWQNLGGTSHRLQLTASNSEDSGALAGFSIADAFYGGADLNNMTVDSFGDALEIAVYTHQDITPPKRVTGFDLHSDNSTPKGVWGNDETFWVANDGSGATDKVYAYNRSDGSRDTSSDFDNLNTAGNNDIRGICSDGTTMFVADSDDNKVYAYKMSDTTADSTKDVTLASGNDNAKGVWCDADTIWVAEDEDGTTSKIYAYKRSDGTHDSAKDVTAANMNPSTTVGGLNNSDPRGIWANADTMFVVDDEDQKVYAYKTSDRTGDTDKNIALDTANADAEGLWFDGRVLWVVDDADDRVYVYDLPGAQPDNTRADGTPEVRTPIEDIWSATMTVGTRMIGSLTLHGWGDSLPYTGASLTDDNFTFGGDTYDLDEIYLQGGALRLIFDEANAGDIATKATRDKLVLHVGNDSFNLGAGILQNNQRGITWSAPGLSWSASDTISVSISFEPAPTDGVELRADTSGITDATDGLDNVFYHYQWIRVDGTTVTELDGETGATYTATADDVTKDIQVRVIFDDDVRNQEYPRYSPQVTVQETPPVVTGVALTSDPNDDGRTGNDDTYAIGDTVTATVTFDKAVDVTSGPQITLLFRTAEKAADCAAATNTTTMECSYTVLVNENASSGVGIKANTLALNSGTIYATGSTTNSATLTHSALALQSGHKVDGIRPALVQTGILSPRTSGDGSEVILTFSKDIGGVIRANITIYDANDNTSIFSTASHSISGNTVELTLTTALTESTTSLEMDLAAGAVTDTVGNFNAELNGSTVLNQLSAAPWAPSGFSAEPAPDATPQLAVALSWTAPSSDGGSAITSHQYRYRVGSGSFGNWTTIENSAAGEANATSFTVTGLPATATPPIAFVFEVRAVNDNGNGAESPPRTATIDVPDTISSFTTTIGNQQVEFAWATPENNGSAILRYQYYVIDSTDNTFVVANNTNIPNSDASTTSFTITGLTNGVSYEVGIQAVNSVGGAGYDPGSVTPATHPTAPRNLRAEAGDTQVTLRWTAPLSNGGVAIDGYEYQQKTGNAPYGSWTDISGADDTTTEHIVTGLTNGTSYRFKVRAKNPTGGEGPASNEVTAVPRTVPTAPQSLTATAGNGRVQLDWTAPASDGGLPINRYQYRYKAGTGSFTTWANVPGSNINTTSYTVTGLTNGTLHTFEVRAATASTVGVAASDTATPMAVAPGKPSVTVQSRDTALYVSWTLEDDGGSNITEYQMQWKSGAQGFDSSRQQAGLTATNTRIENLINGTEYDVRVRAMNSAGWGLWSEIVPGTPVEGPAVSFSTVTLSIDEGGSGAYSVVLTTEPTATVAILVSRGGDVTTEPNTLRFTASNWNIWQSVTVNAGQDGDADDDTVAITHTVHPGSAAEYVALTDAAIVQVTVLDDDVPPPPVRGFSAADESQDAVALSWWSERGAAEYQLEYRKRGDTGAWTRVTRGDFDHLPSTSGNRSLTAIATGLECETTYDFRIRLRGSGDILLNIFGPHTEISHKTGQCAQPDRPTNLMYTLAPDCATLTWTAPTGGDYTGVRIRRLTRGDDNYTVIHERLNSRPTSYRDCTNTGDGYGDGDNSWYAYRVTYVKFESGLLMESKHAKSGLHQYGPAFQDHLHATPRNVRLTRDTDSQRRMSWDAPPSWSLTTWAGLQGASVPVRDPWITGYVVERREFRARADGYLYFSDEDEDLTIWSATMTVGESSDDQRVGYSRETNNHYGSLSQDTFNHVAGRYRVLDVWYRPSRLQLSLGGTPPPHAAEDWDLVINGDRFPLADALIDPNGFTLISWTTSSLSWANGQQVSVQLVDRDRYGWKTVREGGDANTSTSFTDNEQANGRKFVYRIRSTNKYGVSTTHSIFDWLWDSPHRDAVIDLAATDTTTDDSSSGSTGDGRTNNAATGAPTIGGTPQVGGTLTASTSPIDDQDGLTNATFEYQWVAGGSDIDGATGSTYTLTYSEQGQTIQVRVAFTDDRNNAETLTSIATAAVAAAAPPLTATFPVSPYQSARHKGGDDRPQVIVAFSRPVASFEKTTPSVSLTGAAVSSVRRHQEEGLENAWIFFLNPDGNDDIVFSLVTGQPCDSDGICTDDGRRLSSAVQTTLPGPDDPNSPATGAPTISGTPQVEQTLTAKTSAIQDADGLQNASYQYQWLAAGSAISGATGSSYTLTSTEEGDTIQVRVSFNDDRGNAESRTSVATEAVAGKPLPLTASFSNMPASHDGSAEFTFDLTFSENFALSYVTLRDHAFTKDAQNEDHVVAARRKVPGSNQTWTITVKPPNNAAITITLPATTDCNASGAICTSDGRMLSHPTSVSVAGPN